MLKPSILNKLESLSERQQELEALLADAGVINNQTKFRSLSMEYAQISPLVACYRDYQHTLDDMETASDLLKDGDADMRSLAQDELREIKQNRDTLEKQIYSMLLSTDPRDAANIFLEIRAGTGGDEAALFAGNLFRMYSQYADLNRWQTEVISTSAGEHGGYKEIIVRIVGKGAYSRLKFESGAHRVQRVPETESQGRIHTSACTVAVLPEAEEVEAVEINPSDLKVDTFRASGAGGQHVNKTDSAIRITHLPSGIVIECQEERSQHKNRARALSLLQARLLSQVQDAQTEEQAQSRKTQVGSGDRSERIRTYNYPQGRLTDHRINLTLYKLDEILAGNLDQVINPLINEQQAEQMAMLGD